MSYYTVSGMTPERIPTTVHNSVSIYILALLFLHADLPGDCIIAQFDGSPWGWLRRRRGEVL